MPRTLFDTSEAKTKRSACPGKTCRRHIEKAVQQMLRRNPSCEATGEVLECFALTAKQLEERMHD